VGFTVDESALALSLKQDSAQGYYKALQKELVNNFNIKLLTFTKINMLERRAKRLFSSDEKSYATGGFKPIEDNTWTVHVIEQQQIFIAHKHSELKKVFFDHELIAKLGLGSVINFPIIIHSNVIGTVNLLAEEGAYLNSELFALEKLTPWLAISFLCD